MAKAQDTLLVSTRKGLFELARRNGSWDIVDTKFLGDPVSAVLAQADGTVYAALDLGHFGAKLWRRGGNGEWSELTAPAFPPKPDDAGDDPHPWTLGRIWGIEPGGVPGRLWAGSMPGAPNWLDPLAATVMMTGGDRNAARAWLLEMRQTATEAWVRRIAERRLAQLVALDQIDQLEALVPAFQQKMHRNPTGWPDFEAAGLLRGLPADPSGVPYVYFPASGRVRLDPSSTLGPLPEFPEGAR